MTVDDVVARITHTYEEPHVNYSVYMNFVRCPYSIDKSIVPNPQMERGLRVHKVISCQEPESILTDEDEPFFRAFLMFAEEYPHFFEDARYEVKFGLDTEWNGIRVPVSGVLDVLFMRDGRPFVLDWKVTTGMRPAPLWVQGIIYQNLLQDALGTSVECWRIWLTPDGFLIDMLYDTEDHWDSIRAGLFAAYMTLVNIPVEKRAPFFSHCPRCLSNSFCDLYEHRKELKDAERSGYLYYADTGKPDFVWD